MCEYKKYLTEIVEDKKSGARELILKLIKAIKKLLSENCGIDDMKKFLFEVGVSRRSIVSLYNVSNLFRSYVEKFGYDNLVVCLDKVSNFVLESPKKIFVSAKKVFHEGAKILTISKSSTVLDVLARFGKDFFGAIYVLKSHPLDEGVESAKRLGELGFNVYLIPDSAMGFYIRNIDFVAVGADAVFVDGFVNKIGTFPLALIARHYMRGFYVLADSTKILPTKAFFDQEYADPKIVYENGGQFHVLAPLFEFIPRNLVTSYITENGLFAPEKILDSRKKFLEEIFGLSSESWIIE